MYFPLGFKFHADNLSFWPISSFTLSSVTPSHSASDIPQCHLTLVFTTIRNLSTSETFEFEASSDLYLFISSITSLSLTPCPVQIFTRPDTGPHLGPLVLCSQGWLGRAGVPRQAGPWGWHCGLHSAHLASFPHPSPSQEQGTMSSGMC